MITEPGLSNDVSHRYDDDDTNLDFEEDELRIHQNPESWITQDKDDDTDLNFEEPAQSSGRSLTTCRRDSVRFVPDIFEFASYQVASKCNISLIADGPVDREVIRNLIDQLMADLDSGLFDKSPGN